MKKNLITMAASLAVTVTILGMAVPIGEVEAAGEKTNPLNVEFVEEKTAVGETVDCAEVETGVPALPGAVEETHTAVSNNGEIDAYVFLQVKVPMVRSEDVVLECVSKSINPSESRRNMQI